MLMDLIGTDIYLYFAIYYQNKVNLVLRAWTEVVL